MFYNTFFMHLKNVFYNTFLDASKNVFHNPFFMHLNLFYNNFYLSLCLYYYDYLYVFYMLDIGQRAFELTFLIYHHIDENKVILFFNFFLLFR